MVFRRWLGLGTRVPRKVQGSRTRRHSPGAEGAVDAPAEEFAIIGAV